MKKSTTRLLLLVGFACVVVLAPSAQAAIELSNVRALYHLEDANDSSGNGFNLTNTGSVTFTAGKLGNAANSGANNTSKLLEISNDLGVDGGTISMGGWFYTTTTPNPTVESIMVCQGNDASDVDYSLKWLVWTTSTHSWWDRGKIFNGQDTAIYGPLTVTSTWRHVVGVADGSASLLSLYVDGTLQATKSYSGVGSGAGYDRLKIFGNCYNDGRWFSGLADELFVTNSALSSTTIALLYNNGSGTEICVDCSGPPTISSLAQYRSNAATTIAEGATTTESTVVFKALLQATSSNSLELQVEVRLTSSSFTDTPTATSSYVSSGSTASTSQSLSNGNYKWQARVVTAIGASSSWVAFGATSTPDFIVAVTAPSTTRVPILDGSVRALYHLEDRSDASGNGYHLTNTNSVSFIPGKLGNAASAGSNNTSKLLEISNDLGIDGGTISMGGWFYTQTLPSPTVESIMLCQGNDASDVDYSLKWLVWTTSTHSWWDRGKISNGQHTAIFGPVASVTSTWHHIVGTVDGSHLRLYIDGELKDTESYSGSGNGAGYDRFKIFGQCYNDGRWFSGLADEVFVTNSTLSSSTVALLYNDGDGAEICSTAEDCGLQKSGLFDGDDGWGYSAEDISFHATDDFTIEVWYGSSTNSAVRLLDSRNNASNFGYSLSQNATPSSTVGITFTLKCATDEIVITASTTNTQNYLWNHVVIAKSTATSSNAFTVYINGTTDDVTVGRSGGPIDGNCFVSPTSANQIWFGRDADSSQAYLAGNIDEVRIWSEERPANSIEATFDIQVNTSSPNLVHYWRFNSSTRELVEDSDVVASSGTLAFSTSSPFGHFILGYSAVDEANKEIRWGSSTKPAFNDEVAEAIVTWETQTSGAINIIDASSSATSTWELAFDLVDTDEAPWTNVGGRYTPGSNFDPDPGYDFLYLNDRYITTSAQAEHIALHELGHALGLGHSIFGNIMFWKRVENLENLYFQDKKDYEYLW